MDQDSQRRRFLKLGSIAVVTAMAGDALAQAKADKKADKGAPRLAESDPQAQALGYKEDATKVDRKKFANYQPGQVCSTCTQFQGTKEAYAPCAAFAGKAVNAKGWCAAWVKKA